MSSPVSNDHPAQQPETVVPTAAPVSQPLGESNGGRTATQPLGSTTHTITIQRIPHCVWVLARENAKQSCLPLRYYLIRLFAASTPIPLTANATTQRTPDNQPSHAISVSRVPYLVWAHVRHNAMLSQRTFSNYLIELLEQSSPLSLTVNAEQPSQLTIQ